jgi:transposase
VKENSITTPEITIGIDLGDRSSELCILGRGSKRPQFETSKTTRTALVRALRGYPGARVVFETGTHSPWLARLLMELGYEVIVAHARQVHLITKSDRKDDRFDAEQLARLGRVDPALLGPVSVRSEQASRDLMVLKTRAALVSMRTEAINQARGLAKSLGYRLPRCSSTVLPQRVREKCGLELFPGLREQMETIEVLSEKIAGLEVKIEELSTTRYPQTALLRQVRGVGPITALTFVLTIEDPHRFERSRTVGAYLGLRPRKRDSGQRHPELRISKSGDTTLRYLLVQAAHYILGPFGTDTDLRRYGERIAGRGGAGAKKKAVVAVARKLSVLLHRLWVSGEVYEPIGYGRLDEEIAA